MRTDADLAKLTWSWHRYDGIHLVTDELDAVEKARWERRLFTSYTACGCHAGGAAVLLALVALVVEAFVTHADLTWPGVVLRVGICLAAALAGKLIGIAGARLRLQYEIRRVRPLVRTVFSDTTLPGWVGRDAW